MQYEGKGELAAGILRGNRYKFDGNYLQLGTRALASKNAIALSRSRSGRFVFSEYFPSVKFNR